MTTDQKMERIFKKCMRQWYKGKHGAPKAVRPLTEEARRISESDEWESFTEYGFLSGTGYTDDEIREILDGMRLRVTSPYDCSGQLFTMWITFHRNPSGLISYTHKIGIDV